MKRIFAALVACVALVASSVFAQDRTAALAPSATEAAAWPANLPRGEMKGRWDWQGMGNSMSNTWSLKLENYDPATGAVQGKLTFYGNNCNARDTSVTGTYKDEVLIIQANLGFKCDSDQFVLKKGPPGRLQGAWANNVKFYLN